MVIDRQRRAGWTFLTNHAHVLLCIARDPNVRIREIAALVGITERAAQRIVGELGADGYLTHRRIGRRNHYEIDDRRPMRHALENHLSVSALLDALTARS